MDSRCVESGSAIGIGPTRISAVSKGDHDPQRRASSKEVDRHAVNVETLKARTIPLLSLFSPFGILLKSLSRTSCPRRLYY